MTIHNPELIRQHEAHNAVRARLNVPALKQKAAAPIKTDAAMIDKLTREVKFQRDCLKHAAAADVRVGELELALADAQARILAQAEIIGDLRLRLEQDSEEEPIDEGLPAARAKRPVFVIVEEVLRDFPGVTWDEVKSVRRTKRLIVPRQLCMHAVHVQRPDLSFPQIGRAFGGRDHTTIMHAVRKVGAMKAGTGNHA